MELKELDSLCIGKLQRKKIKVARKSNFLENAIYYFEKFSHKKGLLEFEFYDEEGSGLGPTLEYYQLIATELQNKKYLLWREFTTNHDLFPNPLNYYKNQSQEFTTKDIAKLFKFIGQVAARAILDERIFDLQLHPLFWDLVLGRQVYIWDLARLDQEFGSNFLKLQSLINSKAIIQQNSTLSTEEKEKQQSALTFQECNLEDLCLNFTFPGANHIELISKGATTYVNLQNLDSYIEKIFQFFFQNTIEVQVNSFRVGFEKVIPLNSLLGFDSSEISQIFCGASTKAHWEYEELVRNIIPSYGYNQESVQFNILIEIMTELTENQQKLFLKFVTGSIRLPFGGNEILKALKLSIGFANLNPKLTIVKKQPDFPYQVPDQLLPSVMTCQNYIKLPEYSSKNQMKDKLLYAMNEGCDNFALS